MIFRKPHKPNRPILPGGDRWFIQSEFLSLLEAVSHDVRLCKRQVVQVANPDYGIPERVEMVCRKLHAYVNQSDIEVIAAGGGVVQDTSFTVVIVAASSNDPQFSPNEVTSDSYFWVDNVHGGIDGRYMQGVLTREVSDYGYPPAWFYRLKETVETLDLPISENAT